ncbi:hypothetical protein HPB50_002799 [Hyalomma asiaticum]|uniref:Uncharacterized protein n=1 Tax=Hyalomma asiaticum TaxID=266040 RepID=A0ACB7S6B5_HYAAI|nr:hypothetical protein HPB50_002799 [Hyalomma asiaticum]
MLINELPEKRLADANMSKVRAAEASLTEEKKVVVVGSSLLLCVTAKEEAWAAFAKRSTERPEESAVSVRPGRGTVAECAGSALRVFEPARERARARAP